MLRGCCSTSMPALITFGLYMFCDDLSLLCVILADLQV